jgi:hypothetical protein
VTNGLKILAKSLHDEWRIKTVFIIYSHLLSVKINNTTECHQYKPDADVVKAAKKACTSYLNQCASAK